MGLQVLETFKMRFIGVIQRIRDTRISGQHLAKFVAYFLPVAFLIYAIFINFSSTGIQSEFVLNVGGDNDTDNSTLRIEPSLSLSDKRIDNQNKTYRQINGLAYAVFHPPLIQSNSIIHADIDGGNAAFIQNSINFIPDEKNWDYKWNFDQGIPSGFTSTTAFTFDKQLFFDGKSTLEYRDSSNLFENGPFTIFIEYKPMNIDDDFQQIVGHFNWEILQEKNQVRFMVGRMEDKNGIFNSIAFPINGAAFFGKKHQLLATYYPDPQYGNGYIELYVDNVFAGRQTIGGFSIWKDYNGATNLSLGQSKHKDANAYKGFISRVYVASYALSFYTKDENIENPNGVDIYLPIFASTTQDLRSIKIHVTDK